MISANQIAGSKNTTALTGANPFPYRLLGRAGDIVLVLSFVGMVASVLMAYGLEHHFSIITLVIFHIAIMVMAAFIKLGYVMRLTACNELAKRAATPTHPILTNSGECGSTLCGY